MMRSLFVLPIACLLFIAPGCGGGDDPDGPALVPGLDAAADLGAAESGDEALEPEAGVDAAAPDVAAEAEAPDAAAPDAPQEAGCGAPAQCAAEAEERAADKLQSLLDDSAALQGFLREVPKGGDLHHHLSGAVYAETYMQWARAEGGYCINMGSSNYLALSTSCASGATPVPAPSDSLFPKVVAAWSMEGFVPSGSVTGHDHFFATFGKFGAISGNHHGKMLADVMARAATENEVYIELMLTSNSSGQNLGQDVWSANHGSTTLSESHLAAFHAELLAASGLSGAVNAITNRVQQSESEAYSILGCAGTQPAPGCSVATRYMVYISRSGTTAGVFGQLVAAYEAAIKDPRVVAVNLVGPEDGTTALSRYDLHMAMLGYLYDAYRLTNKSPLRLSLHAGELAAKYMPPGYDIGSIDHVRKAMHVARADRIGHGVDARLESDGKGLLSELSDNKVLIEICLSSNIQILEISGAEHPLNSFISAGVPVALATDDQGVSRSSMAGEYLRAVKDQALDYRQLKTMARNSLQYSFLPGASLWAATEPYQPVDACAADLGTEPAPPDCAQLLAGSARARVQWELESRFRRFENDQ
jgi:hypothetical protein